jgi:hypothetical protein
VVSGRRRYFSEGDRARFLEAIRLMRDACIDVSRQAPIGSTEYRAADTLRARLDDAVEALTGDRTRFWLKPHSSVGHS